jgi:UDP-N-acetylglucosamine 4-epimerase
MSKCYHYHLTPQALEPSNADITKAKTTVGYAPTHDIYQGMEEAIEWYIEDLKKEWI